MTHRTLVALHKEVHPTDSGSKQRARMLIRAAARTGPVDAVVLTPGLSDVGLEGLHGDGVERVAWLPDRDLGRKRRRSLSPMLPNALRDAPSSAHVRDWYGGLGWELHDVHLYVEPRSWWAMRQVNTTGAVVVDLENVMSTWAQRAARQAIQGAARRRPSAHIRSATQLVEASAWKGVERKILREADSVFVCSDEDKTRLDHAKVAVVPNGYSPPSERVRTSAGRAGGSLVTLIGKLSYAPNLDAARWLRHEIHPRLIRRCPDVTVRVVGRSPKEVQKMAAPGFEVPGFVPDVSAVLAETDVCVVPIRFGGGTRIKILEAWAHEVAVVSTSIGAEGLNATNGHDILIADDAEAIAEAIQRLLTNPDLRNRIASNGLDTFRAHFDATQVETRVAELLSRCRRST